MDNVEKRFSYNPFTKEFLSGYTSHNEQVYNKGKQKEYSQFIRGIIFSNCLYLRTYFPYKDFPDTLEKLNKQSLIILQSFYWELREVLKKNLNFIPQDTIFNAENDLLLGIGLANI